MIKSQSKLVIAIYNFIRQESCERTFLRSSSQAATLSFIKDAKY